MPPEQAPSMQAEPKGNGALVGSIIIVIILIIGGVYLWMNKASAPAPLPEEQGAQVDSTTELETELKGMDLDNLDQDI